jgi:hypothetical protein
MIITAIIIVAVLSLLGYFGYSIRSDQFLQTKEYAEPIADVLAGRLIRWSPLAPRGAFIIQGKYENYKIKMYLYLNETRIYIFSDKLPKQAKLLINYPEVADGILQMGNCLYLEVQHNDTADPILKRTRITEGIQRLIDTAKRLGKVTAV